MKKKLEYTPVGVCSKKITVEIDDTNKITNVEIIGGCPGNTKAVSKLCLGRDVNEIIDILKQIPCGIKDTSCPDQLAIALQKLKETTK